MISERTFFKKDSRRRKLNDQPGDEKPIKSIVFWLDRSGFHPAVLPIWKFFQACLQVRNTQSHFSYLFVGTTLGTGTAGYCA